MYEQYYGFTEKPFSLTPDPRYLFRSESHSNALDLLHFAVDRGDSLVVITGDIGTGKTTLLRTLLDQTNRRTFTALILNPFLTEEDLLLAVLHDFGVLSRSALRGSRQPPSCEQLVAALDDFLVMVAAIGARAVLIIDEAQNLPPAILEQVRALSEPANPQARLQIILVGQLNLMPVLRSAQLRALDERISIRFQLAPLVEEEVSAYVAHRLAVADASRPVRFTARALREVYRCSGGIPRVINLLCDRCLLIAYSSARTRINGATVAKAARGLQLQNEPVSRDGWFTRVRRMFGWVPADERLRVGLRLT